MLIKNIYSIGVLEFRKHIPYSQNKLKKSFIRVSAIDEIEAIQEHNEIFNNYYDVQEYMIMKLNNSNNRGF